MEQHILRVLMNIVVRRISEITYGEAGGKCTVKGSVSFTLHQVL
jgi:hypothetical protein